uniref:Uncharacterized protein n=1 Tax=Rhizophora mucronata TaxID=61149 RepID=A0A2P2J4T7_RHIMU
MELNTIFHKFERMHGTDTLTSRKHKCKTRKGQLQDSGGKIKVDSTFMKHTNLVN